ncbi:MAG: hypothetical protein ACXIVQ_15755 [Acidimicrobiales bacterium]
MADHPFTNLSPDDAAVALRSYGRRYRDAARAAVVDLDGEVDDDRLDEFASRPGGDGRSAIDLIASVAERLEAARDETHAVLVSTTRPVDAALLQPALPASSHSGHLDDEVDRLDRAASSFADRVAEADASHWLVARPDSSGGTATPLDVLQATVAVAVATISDVERVLREVRGRR